MNFVEEVMENFSGGGGGGRRQEEEVVYEQRGNYSGGPPPPQVPAPWVARWAEREARWYFVNESTGETSWEVPVYGGGYGPPRGGYTEEVVENRTYYGEEPQRKDHSLAYGVAGAAAGVIGGALLMHEGEKIREPPFFSPVVLLFSPPPYLFLQTYISNSLVMLIVFHGMTTDGVHYRRPMGR